MQQAMQSLGGEKDSEIAELQDREQQLQAAIDTLCQQHEEALLRAENDKQQVLLIGTEFYYEIYIKSNNFHNFKILFQHIMINRHY